MKPLKEILRNIARSLSDNPVAGVIALCVLAVTALALSGREIPPQAWVILGSTVSFLSVCLFLKHMRSR